MYLDPQHCPLNSFYIPKKSVVFLAFSHLKDQAADPAFLLTGYRTGTMMDIRRRLHIW